MKLQKKSRAIITFFTIFILISSPTVFSINTTKITKNYEKEELPTYFSWRDSCAYDFTSPIKFLNPLPSCEIMALCASIETMVHYKVGYPFGCDLSEAHLFFWSGGNLEWGAYIENALNFLTEYGVPDEDCWPYPKEKKDYPLNTSSKDWKDRTVKIKNWSYLPDEIDEIKKAVINNGPVVAYIDLYKDFLYYISGVYEHSWGHCIGGHWVSIIGFDEDDDYWICENSYGTQWGENGFFKIKYGECGIEKHAITMTDVYGTFPIVYADDNNTLGPWDGSNIHPYQHIQDAINKSHAGWTVFVSNGTYYENIIINKSLNLDGQNPYYTIINGNGRNDVILVNSENVRISGFTIQNSGKNLFDSGLEIRTWDTKGLAIINNNIFESNQIGIYLYWSPNNTIHNNIFTQNNKGLYLWNSYNNIIQNNLIIENNKSGIEFQFSRGRIINNNIKSNEIGIYLNENSYTNLVVYNNIENNSIGILLNNNSKKNRITRNHFIENQKQAFFIRSYPNVWIKNYWSDWPKRLPKRIDGVCGKQFEISFFSFDWLPSPKPLN